MELNISEWLDYKMSHKVIFKVFVQRLCSNMGDLVSNTQSCGIIIVCTKLMF
jgi:hypothetical protein